MGGQPPEADSEQPQPDLDSLAGALASGVGYKVVDKPRTAPVTEALINKMLTRAWVFYMSDAEYLYFRRESDLTDDQLQLLNADDPSTITCGGCTGFRAENDEVGVCPIDSLYHRADQNCDYGFEDPDEWRNGQASEREDPVSGSGAGAPPDGPDRGRRGSERGADDRGDAESGDQARPDTVA